MSSLIETFINRAKAVQTEVLIAGALGDACEKLVSYLKETAIKHVVLSGFDSQVTDLILKRLSAEGIECFNGSVRDCLPGFLCSVTPGHAGISETGTIIIESTSENVRLASMLADHHIILLPVSALYGELPDVEPILEKMVKGDSLYVAFITGPSRTADIERVLTIGVHGPKRVTVILYGE
ncbi:MAG: lactate utilization protein [Thermodesulforhabdaceae bacterium]